MKTKDIKKILILLVVLVSNVVLSQKKPNLEVIKIVDNEIVSDEKLEEYFEKGYIKGMQNGISDEKFAELKKIHGDKLLAKEFILLIEVYTEEELKAKKLKDKEALKDNSKKPKENKVAKTGGALTDEFILNVGDEAQNFTVKTINGETITLSSLRGKVVLLNFWATWCAPCIREFYEIPSEILNEFDKKDFVFLPIAIGEDKEKVVKKMNALREHGIDFDSGIDPKKAIWNVYAKGPIPKNIVIDQNGIINFTLSGNNGNSVKLLQSIIKGLLEK